MPVRMVESPTPSSSSGANCVQTCLQPCPLLSVGQFTTRRVEKRRMQSIECGIKIRLSQRCSRSPCISTVDVLPMIQQPSRRKMLNTSILSSIIFLSGRPISSSCAETETEELERYTDTKEGFTLLRPKSWIKVEKAGATLLFEDPIKGSNNVGVVVTPVRLTTLAQFGDPQFVSNKLIQAEKRKESTKDVEIVSFRERARAGDKDIQVYEFEYNVDSTRGGLKTIFSAAFVASNKLYLLNIAHSQQPPLSNNKRNMLEKVLHSFDVL